ncbi:hypothetical protein A2U01_0002916 [Trifolium medium]|uniref:Uncharacterized protein n=1 Tax=Trifolium medium TaxID=97028 RepID=A0A392M4B3_9FABA|nr:hypothetical protein [Trifolium medium]
MNERSEEMFTPKRVEENRSNDVGYTNISVSDVMESVNNQRSIPTKQIKSDHRKVDAKGSEKGATNVSEEY